MAGYDTEFYARRAALAAQSAEAVVPALAGLLTPRSVVDVGCGDGIWLATFKSHGVETVTGVDGPWVPSARRRLAPAEFVPFDLGHAPLPLAPALPRRRYDLALSLELLEHVDETRADALVELLCSLSDSLVVSAAAPQQGGTGHVNERWPDYWATKFAVHGYRPFDFLRYGFWSDERVAPWYRQNMIGYFRGEVPDPVRRFGEAGLGRLLERPAALCHPGVYAYKLGKLRAWIRNPARSAWRHLRGRPVVG